MLKLVNITKDYILKNSENVHALKGITLNFRRNEFVAILGASGCGKTTLLNIVGGLDRYTSGDLIIEGKSTKEYGDRDWDTYRNHSIGFVFQSYNLITHQSILSNVELALTISGISRAERKERAMKALDKVGLQGMYKKKPNQLSGGQMQRVAIARSLVNNPEILLADEPTGALDSETSIQIMDLLKEVAKDRLVIMVTHNPELANQYATRIVNMKDGLITGDSSPYKGESQEELLKAKEEKKTIEESKGQKEKSSMSMLTATSLSLANLISKMKRTVLVTIAGSIGIIGVSAVLAVSTGVSDYIDTLQDDMLSSYPISISETSVDYTSLMTGLSGWDNKEIMDFDLTTSVGLDSMISYLMNKYNDFTSVKTNDINEKLLKYIESAPKGYYSSLQYDYGIDVTNNIFSRWNQGTRNDGQEVSKMMSLNGLTQMYISELRTVENFGEYAMFVDLFTNFMQELPSDEEHIDYIMSQYDLVGKDSRMATKEDEIVLVVDEQNQTLTDLLYAQLGFFTEEEFLNISRKAIKDNGVGFADTSDEELTYPTSYTFDEILGKELYYYPHQDIYSFESITENTTTFSILGEDTEYKFKLVYNRDCDCLIGTIGTSQGSLSCVLTRPEGVDSGNSESGEWYYKTSISGYEIELKLMLNPMDNGVYVYVDTEHYTGYAPTGSTFVTQNTTTNAYMYQADAQDSWENGMKMKIVGILKKKPNLNFGCLSRGAYYTQAFANKYMLDASESDIVKFKDDSQIEKDGIKTYISRNNGGEEEEYKAYVKFDYTSFIKGDKDPIYDVFGYANCLNSDLSSSLSSMISFTASETIDTDKEHLRSLSGLACKLQSDISGIYKYKFDDTPRSIYLYPQDFASKNNLTDYLDKWNSDETIVLPNNEKLSPESRDELTYVDTVEIIVTAIDTLITAITIALVAFTSLSLVVSCFMIAVITYISVVERTKEIGVIRSLGGRKRDVSNLFIAETFMTGLFSGTFGIIVTYIFQIIFNLAMFTSFKISGIANLTLITALIMISISILLSVVSGLIPSMKASHQDPVLALRSE